MQRINKWVDFFIHKDYFINPKELRQARLITRSSLLTSLFSNSYIWLSLYFEYEKGVYLMIFNVLGFLLLPFLLKTKVPINWIGNFYVSIGASAVIILTYFSGGTWSGIYPWIVSIPILAMLVVDRYSALIWAAISLFVMTWFGWITYQGIEFPIEYNVEMKVIWYVSVLTGLLLIIFVITLVFESNQTKAVVQLEKRNQILKIQKAQIANQSDELKQYIEEKDYTTSILAHDLNNPLSNITTLVHILQTDTTEDEKEKFLNLIGESALNAQALIKKVLDIGEVSKPKIQVQLEEIALSSLMEQLVESLTLSAQKKKINLSYTPGENIMLLSDEIYLKQIFENLISNAIKFSNEGSIVNIFHEIVDENIRITVSDQGPGISDQDMLKIFGKFTRLTAQPTGGESSSGLGLSIVKRFVELLGGTVSCKSQLGQGADFTVEFPLISEAT